MTTEYVNMYDLPKAERQAAEKKNAQNVMREYAGRTFYTRTDYGRGETDYVRIYVATERDVIEDISYYVARCHELTMNNRGIKFGGCQYSKGLEAADYASLSANGRNVRQGRDGEWRELH